MKITLIAACGDRGELGFNGKMPWHIPEDLRHFRKTTEGKAVIMGRKTYESIGKPLPNRLNIILTRDEQFQLDGCLVAHTAEEALMYASVYGHREVFIAGGGEVYKQFIDMADEILLTAVDGTYEADAFFPIEELLKEEWHPSVHYWGEEDGYHFEQYTRLESKNILSVGG